MKTGSLFGSLTAMAHSNGLSSFEYSDDRGEDWMEIRPPPAATIQVPFYGYRTHSMRLIVNCHLDYWLEALGQCVRSGSFQSETTGGLDISAAQAVLDLLADGTSTLCQSRENGHPYQSTCCRLVENRTGSTQCQSCLGLSTSLLHSSTAEIHIL